jgi:hypothetical protein
MPRDFFDTDANATLVHHDEGWTEATMTPRRAPRGHLAGQGAGMVCGPAVVDPSTARGPDCRGTVIARPT